ncbi:MAG: hypothetical protein V4793_34560, partial [Paraburkholderia tropica]
PAHADQTLRIKVNILCQHFHVDVRHFLTFVSVGCRKAWQAAARRYNARPDCWLNSLESE